MAWALLMLMFGAAALLGISLRLARRKDAALNASADPLCGNCGYCVRGLDGNVCPECGSDLRVVGIIMPGEKRPINRAWRGVIWTAASLPGAFLFAVMLSNWVGPQWMVTNQRRVIFSQMTYCNTTVTANATGKKLVFGAAQIHERPPVPPQIIFLSGNNVNQSLDIRLSERTCGYFDASGKLVSGNFDAKAIETWLNAQGFKDPRVAEAAANILAAVNEMGTPAETGFTRFPPDRWGNSQTGVAHPTFTTSQARANELTYLFDGGVIVLIWLAGLAVVLRRRHFRGAGASPVLDPQVITGGAPAPR